jgi:phosphotransferase system  glucose/maltose/N-acetylglucosamine-specific IIC component
MNLPYASERHIYWFNIFIMTLAIPAAVFASSFCIKKEGKKRIFMMTSL